MWKEQDPYVRMVYDQRSLLWFMTKVEYYKKRYFLNKASVALNPLVSLIGRLVAIIYGFTKWLLLEARHEQSRI